MNLFKLQNLAKLPAKGYAYLFAKPNKTLSFVDDTGFETVLGRDIANSSIPFTAFDFSTVPNGALPANDSFGNPFFLELGAGGASAVPLVDNGALRTTGIAGSGATAFYMGLKQNGIIYEVGCKAVLGDGLLALLVTQGPSPGVFSNPNWAMHLKVTELGVSYELWVANAAVLLKSAGTLLSKTAQHDIVVKFNENTARVFINGVFVLDATDSRISSFTRNQAIFEPFHSSANVAHTRIISGYTKTAKQASYELVGVPLPPARHFPVNLGTAITLTGSDQAILGNTRLANVSEAMVTVRMRVNQTAPGDIILNVIGMTFSAAVTNNEAVISKIVKDDIVTSTIRVTGIFGAFFRVMVRGAFGTIPATPTVPEQISISVVPIAWNN